MIVPGQLADSVAEPAVRSIDESAAEHCPRVLQIDRLAHQVSGAALDQPNGWRIRRRFKRAVDIGDTNFLVLRAQTIVRAVAERAIVDLSNKSHFILPVLSPGATSVALRASIFWTAFSSLRKLFADARLTEHGFVAGPSSGRAASRPFRFVRGNLLR